MDEQTPQCWSDALRRDSCMPSRRCLSYGDLRYASINSKAADLDGTRVVACKLLRLQDTPLVRSAIKRSKSDHSFTVAAVKAQLQADPSFSPGCATISEDFQALKKCSGASSGALSAMSDASSESNILFLATETVSNCSSVLSDAPPLPSASNHPAPHPLVAVRIAASPFAALQEAPADGCGPSIHYAVNSYAKASLFGSSPQASLKAYRRAQSAFAAFELEAEQSEDDDTEEATKQITGAYRSSKSTAFTSSRTSSWGGRLDLAHCASSVSTMDPQVAQDEDDADSEKLYRRQRSSYHLTNSQAAVELFLRLNHARQTMDFVKRQTESFAALDKAEMSSWEALSLLNELREYESALVGADDLSPDMPLLDHALQTAELCRLAYPDLEWLHLVGLIHSLGKLLAHRRFGSQPQWAICGESFPVGCRFSPQIMGSQYFTANPDRRRRVYNTQTGIYEPHCGLSSVYMSWSASEYMYLVLVLNQTKLPAEALFLVRHQKFLALTKPNSCYLPLLSEADRKLVPLLAVFQELTAYRTVELPKGALHGDALQQYYSALMLKYLGPEKLLW